MFNAEQLQIELRVLQMEKISESRDIEKFSSFFSCIDDKYLAIV